MTSEGACFPTSRQIRENGWMICSPNMLGQHLLRENLRGQEWYQEYRSSMPITFWDITLLSLGCMIGEICLTPAPTRHHQGAASMPGAAALQHGRTYGLSRTLTLDQAQSLKTSGIDNLYSILQKASLQS